MKFRKIPKISPGLIKVRKHFLAGLSKYNSSTYALSMFIHFPNYTHRIPKVSPGHIFGEDYIQKDIWVSLQEVYNQRGAYIWDSTVYIGNLSKQNGNTEQQFHGIFYANS